MSPPQQVAREGQERRPLPPLCPDRSGRRAQSQSRGKGPASQRVAQCHGCSVSPRPAPSCLPVAALPPTLSACLPFLALPSLSSCLPSFLSFFPLSFILTRFLLSFPPSFLPFSLGTWRRASVLLSQAVSGSVSLRLCPLMSSWSQSGPGPSERSAALLSIASSHPRTRQGSPPPGLGGRCRWRWGFGGSLGRGTVTCSLFLELVRENF